MEINNEYDTYCTLALLPGRPGVSDIVRTESTHHNNTCITTMWYYGTNKLQGK